MTTIRETLATILFLISGPRHQAKFVAYSLRTGELMRGAR